ncbi:hypothetical protein [Metalysinibacillus jejuensis]|uniref:hypothetical protein n=1 Tax=Metalysinibacillus jejuensis TaxID=914327 RepID=UPI000D3A3E4A|nr:hypothetical protein [Metalysinibacillus jejuensis]
MATFIYMCDVIQEEELLLHRIQPGDEANHANIVFVIRTGEQLSNAVLEVIKDQELVWSSALRQTPKLNFDAMLPIVPRAHLLYKAEQRFDKLAVLPSGGKCVIQLTDNGKVLRKRTILFTSLEQDLYHTDNYADFADDSFAADMMQTVEEHDYHGTYTKYESDDFTDIEAKSFGDGVAHEVATKDLSAHGLDVSDYTEVPIEYLTKEDVPAIAEEEPMIDLSQIDPNCIVDIEAQSFGDGIDDDEVTEDLSAHGLDVSDYGEVAIEYIAKEDVPEEEEEPELDMKKVNFDNIQDI